MPPSTPPHPSRQEQTQRTPPQKPGTETPRSSKRPTNGLYQDGRWWCECPPSVQSPSISSPAHSNLTKFAFNLSGNCHPRKLCAHLQTKKQGPNTDRWFHRCEVRSCGFFIWENEARLRERVPVEREDLPSLPNDLSSLKQRSITSFGFSITPTSQVPRRHWPLAADEEGEETESGSGSSAGNSNADATGTGTGTPCPPSRKRKHDVFQDEDDLLLEEMTLDEERQLAALTDQHSSARPQRYGAVPAPPPLGVNITPATTRVTDRVGGLITPVRRNLFPDARSGSNPNKHPKTVSFEDRLDASTTISASPFTISTTSTAAFDNSRTPTQSNPTKTPSSSTTISPSSAHSVFSTPQDDVDTTKQVMILLASQQQSVDPNVLSAIRDLLETSARKTKGLLLARDSTRSLLREKDLKITRQQERIMHLEHKDRVSQKRISTMKADIMNIYQAH